MGNLFKPRTKVAENNQQPNLEVLCQYEEHYMRLLRHYSADIEKIQSMMENLRKERETFYQETLPEIERQIQADNILSEEAKAQWIEDLHDNMEASFRLSEKLIDHYVTSNLDEFKAKLKQAVERV